VPLNTRQALFVHEYLKEDNATQAAIRAGYSPKTAYSIGSRLLKRVDVKDALSTKALQIADKADVSAARVLKEYSRIAFLNPQSMYDKDGRMLSISEMPEDAARAIAGLEEEDLYEGRGEERTHIGRLKKIRLAPKVAALEGLARHLGMFQAENPSLQQAFAITIHVGKEE